MADQRETHDIIVIGVSAGALSPLRQIMSALPADLPAAVFIVLHLGRTSHLAWILDGSGPLPVAPARSGALIERRRVYVGVPDRHLLLHDSHLLLSRGPRENMVRPAIDPLFRSAAASFGARVIGVLLSGSLNDGAAGLRAIKRCGGIALVQDPQDAQTPEMPLAALRHVEVDYCMPAARIGATMAELSTQPAGPTPPIPLDIQLETAIAAQELADMSNSLRLCMPSPFSCPECHGPLYQVPDQIPPRYRCHIGHAFTGESLAEAQAREADRTLQDLFRLTCERAELLRRLGEKAAEEGKSALAAHFNKRAADYLEDAKLVRSVWLRSTAESEAGGGVPGKVSTDGEKSG